MATVLLDGPRTWSGSRDEEGHRTYKIVFLVKGLTTDGPANALNTPGLPLPGSPWLFDDDVDFFAWCRPQAEVTPLVEDEPNNYFEVEMTFSSKPPERNKQRCNDIQIEDPILEPPRISGSFTRFTEEATQDRYGRPILNSAFEQMRGPHVEFDRSRPAIRIEQNLLLLQYGIAAQFMDCVNSVPLWGLPARTIKLSSFSWERKFHGFCYLYYTRTLEFEINYNGWDRNLLDEGTKVLNGEWDFTTGAWIPLEIGGEDPSPNNPSHFIRFKDKNGENTRVVLNGYGLPALSVIGLTHQYVCTANSSITGPPEFDNQNRWFPFVMEGLPDLSLIPDWNPEDPYYPYGFIVLFAGDYYIANKNITEDTGIPGVNPNISGDWLNLGPTLSEEGPHNPASIYAKGDIVSDPARETGPGNIHVEKYTGVNFLLLGIPLTF